jgi:hypothetical protein
MEKDTIELLRYWTKIRNSTRVYTPEFNHAHAQVQKYTDMRRLELRDKPQLFPKAIEFEIGSYKDAVEAAKIELEQASKKEVSKFRAVAEKIKVLLHRIII